MIKDKELKMKLMEKLMEEMGDSEMGKFKKEEDPEVMVKEVSADVMPMSKAKDMIQEKMMAGGAEEDEEDEDGYMGEFYEKIKEKKRKMKEMA